MSNQSQNELPQTENTTRSKTFDTTKSMEKRFKISPTDPFYFFNKYCEEVQNLFPKDVRTTNIEGIPYDDKYKAKLIKIFSKPKIDEKDNEVLAPIAQKIVEAFDSSRAFDSLLNYPPRIFNPTPEVKTFTYLLLELIRNQDSNVSSNVIKWVYSNLAPSSCLKPKLFKSKYLKAFCLCHRKTVLFTDEALYWSLLDVNDHFIQYKIVDNRLEKVFECDPYTIILSHSRSTVKLFDRNNNLLLRFVPIDSPQLELWCEIIEKAYPPPLPLFFTSTHEVVPDIVMYALHEVLISPDFLVIRAACHFTVSKISAGPKFIEAVFDIFAYSNMASILLEVLAINEFVDPNLRPDTVLRGNSQLANLFKVFHKRYGKAYFDDFLKRVVLYIDSKGDLKIRTPVEADSQKVKTMAFTVIKRISRSLEHVPLEIRHFASILKDVSALRFNNKQATYSTLSGFFILRFVAKFLSTPKEIDPNIQLKNEWQKVLVPAAQFLNTPFNLNIMDGKYEVFSSWNSDLNKLFPEFINFVFSIPIIDEPPVYQRPSKERLREALDIVMQEICTSNGKFAEVYDSLFKQTNNCSPQAWNFAIFLASFFPQNNRD